MLYPHSYDSLQQDYQDMQEYTEFIHSQENDAVTASFSDNMWYKLVCLKHTEAFGHIARYFLLLSQFLSMLPSKETQATTQMSHLLCLTCVEKGDNVVEQASSQEFGGIYGPSTASLAPVITRGV